MHKTVNMIIADFKNTIKLIRMQSAHILVHEFELLCNNRLTKYQANKMKDTKNKYA